MLVILKLADMIAKYLYSKNIIEDDVEIYRHGIALYISECISFSSIIVISLFTRHTLYTIGYILLFSKMRETFGGFHCKSFLTCNLTYITIYILFELLLIIMVPQYIQIICSIVCTAIIWKLAPVDHANKILSETMKNGFSKEAKGLIVITLICFYLISFINKNMSLMIWYCILTNTILLITGKLVRNYEERTDGENCEKVL
ncbi:accessory gene regulator B family protein [Absiella sp. AM29-15]|uniref:accessory gene regulator B family protein n=1 Tax=Absiella sp. AM29-15 TaxID=2292278 RepID=UPI000E415045|nr:accessory gene regulator B family protein [Absiella sp. AM29-15]RGC47128.1 hypothetical protein DW761_15955 [Absiella sp. AM29-15]